MDLTLRAELIAPLAGLLLLRATLGNDAAIIGAVRDVWGVLEVR